MEIWQAVVATIAVLATMFAMGCGAIWFAIGQAIKPVEKELDLFRKDIKELFKALDKNATQADLRETKRECIEHSTEAVNHCRATCPHRPRGVCTDTRTTIQG